MTTTDEQIAALEANREALKSPLRERYAVVAAEIATLRAPERSLQAQRDSTVDELTPAADRALCLQILAARAAAERAGVLELEAEAKKILRSLKDEDGKIRLTAA
ncbi:hypothetical protein [uncultured Hyphomicrobium sp.]|uniref:hypothetical protein n=1 Tax=uncultured Hyphomicrobium sp. TaxID=194373 RepID=UPI0025F693EA|nr:hypothetical protein [uncultured Hyphomicrobium sp.]